MPYIHDKGYVLSASQERLRQSIIQCAFLVKQHIIEKWGNEHFGWKISQTPSYILGWLMQPAYFIESGSIHIPEKKYEVIYRPRYGVICQNLCSSNGSAWTIASCVRDDTTWIENTESLKEIY
jgi:hypothetical protein